MIVQVQHPCSNVTEPDPPTITTTTTTTTTKTTTTTTVTGILGWVEGVQSYFVTILATFALSFFRSETSFPFSGKYEYLDHMGKQCSPEGLVCTHGTRAWVKNFFFLTHSLDPCV